MFETIHRLYRAAQYSRLTRKLSVLAVLSRFSRLDLAALEYDPAGSRVLIRGTEIDPTTAGYEFLLRGSDCVRRLLDEAGAVFRPLPDGVLIEVGGVRLKLQYWEELFIAKEVFAEAVYNLLLDEPYILIDVGLNVGTTSLFHANKPNCRAVYAFELFPRTAEKARANIALNPDLAGKIVVTAKGLAAQASVADLEYDEEYKGSVGIGGLPDYLKHTSATPRTRVPVEFVGCQDALPPLLERHRDLSAVCKLDCEGAEYEILEALAAQGILNQIAYFLIEWHGKGAGPVEKILKNHGFALLSFSPHAPSHSMIYGWRKP